MENCIFCKIIRGEAQGKIVYEDEIAIAIADIHPQAPVHLLVVPREHIETLAATKVGDERLMGHLFRIATELARAQGLESRGYRTVINNGAGAGQSVFHLHVHLLGGRVFHWPPG
ncbi:MAG TPA: histidine triad nucleotide-binding protein [Terriglobia bacterium]